MLSPARSRPLVRLASSTVHAQRRGRNLTDRYRTLERATHVVQGSESAAKVTVSLSTPTFVGFVVPKEPQAPADDECCMSGCAVCVYDLYEEALAAYKDSASLSALHIPETQWPPHIRTSTHTSPASTEKAVLTAFEEMERALKEKRDKRAAVEADSSS